MKSFLCTLFCDFECILFQHNCPNSSTRSRHFPDSAFQRKIPPLGWNCKALLSEFRQQAIPSCSGGCWIFLKFSIYKLQRLRILLTLFSLRLIFCTAQNRAPNYLLWFSNTHYSSSYRSTWVLLLFHQDTSTLAIQKFIFFIPFPKFFQ